MSRGKAYGDMHLAWNAIELKYDNHPCVHAAQIRKRDDDDGGGGGGGGIEFATASIAFVYRATDAL